VVRSVLRLWALSLMLSALLAAAGERWPAALPIEPTLVAALVLVPPLVMLIWLGWHWTVPGVPAGSGSGDRGQSQNHASMEP